MWFNLLSMGVKTASHIYQNKQKTKQLMSDAQMRHAEKMSTGQIEYKAKVIESNDKGWKDEFVLVLVSLPILVLVYSIFTDDPEIRNRLDMFFEYFKELQWAKWVTQNSRVSVNQADCAYVRKNQFSKSFLKFTDTVEYFKEL